jgi:WD40 repeat protein
MTGFDSFVSSVAYSPDGKHIVSGSGDTTVTIWDSQTGEEASFMF